MSDKPKVWRHLKLREVMKKFSALNMPIEATLELTYRCNLTCVHCYADCKDLSGELTFDEWRDVLNQLKTAGFLYLLFTGGEIMVRSDFLDIASEARSRGFFVSFLSNCTLVTPEIAYAIAELKPMSVGTSLYGASASTHDSVTKVPGSFEKTVRGVKLLVGAGLVPRIQSVMIKSFVAELPKIKRLAGSLGATSSATYGLAPTKSGSYSPSQYEPSDEELLEFGRQSGLFSVSDEDGPGFCKAGRSNCCISPNGDVNPCNVFPLKLGNLKQSSFDSIWRIEPCDELRYLRSMRRSDLNACRSCEVKAYCHRCTAVAFIETGHFDSQSPIACRWARMCWRLNQATEVT